MLDFVFPNLCVSCKKHVVGRGICGDCCSGIDFLDKQKFCSVCGIPFAFENDGRDKEHLCARCLRDSFCFTKARFIAYYDGLLKELLHLFKYRRKLYIGEILSDILAAKVPSDFNFFDLILPVPVHLNKLREREYNQSAILGKKLFVNAKHKYDPFTLYKTKDTPPQISFKSLNDRKRNVRNSFSVRSTKEIKNKSVLLIDDVFTTGSTADECSKVLLKAGAASVQVLTLMRANKSFDF